MTEYCLTPNTPLSPGFLSFNHQHNVLLSFLSPLSQAFVRLHCIHRYGFTRWIWSLRPCSSQYKSFLMAYSSFQLYLSSINQPQVIGVSIYNYFRYWFKHKELKRSKESVYLQPNSYYCQLYCLLRALLTSFNSWQLQPSTLPAIAIRTLKKLTPNRLNINHMRASVLNQPTSSLQAMLS